MSDVNTETPSAKTFNAEAFAMNIAKAMETSGQALAAYLKPREGGEPKDKPPSEIGEVIKTFTKVAEYWLTDTQRAEDLQTRMGKAYLDLWGQAARRMAGEAAKPAIEPSPRDKRFKDPEWKSNQFFDFVLQLYLLTAQWAQELVKNADGLDPHTRKKAEFYVQQISNAIAPSNFILTNPEVLRETLASNGDNLVRGMRMLAEDIEAGRGTLRIRQSDPSNLVVGINMATTPGKVIFQNELMQLIQYTPTTETVLRTPLLIVPPWINKFYILDLKPEKSYIKWCVDQGITVFVISWVNPDKELGKKTFDDYMKEGPLTAMDIIEKVTGEMKVHTAGYCVGGTLLASTLAWLAEKRRQRVTSATFFAAQVDFTHAGDLLVFVDEDQITALERDMHAAGVLEGSKMAMAFNMLRSNDLIWSYVVSNYLKGQPALRLRPAALEFRRHADAGGQPFLLSAQLLSGEPALLRQHGARQHAARPVEGQGARLQSGDQRGSHRAGGFSALRLAVLRRPGEICAVRLRPHRRRGQPAGRRQVPVLDQRQHQGRHARRLAEECHRAQGLVVARLAAMAGEPGRRAGARARGRLRRDAADRGCARQLRPGPRIAPTRVVGYNHASRAGIRNRLRGNQ